MKIDVKEIVNGSIEKLEKTHRVVKTKITEQLEMIVDVLSCEIEGEKGFEVLQAIDTMLENEFEKHVGSYMIVMDRIRLLIENGL